MISRRKGIYRTSGIYGHWPKFLNCKKRDWDYHPHPYLDMPEVVAQMKEIAAGNKAYHSRCKIPWHITYVGYLRIVTKRGNLTFWYMGNPYRHKILEYNATI